MHIHKSLVLRGAGSGLPPPPLIGFAPRQMEIDSSPFTSFRIHGRAEHWLPVPSTPRRLLSPAKPSLHVIKMDECGVLGVWYVAKTWMRGMLYLEP